MINIFLFNIAPMFSGLVTRELLQSKRLLFVRWVGLEVADFENGFLVFMGKEAVLGVRLTRDQTQLTTFTDLSRK